MPRHERAPSGHCQISARSFQTLVPTLDTDRLHLRAPAIEDFPDYATIVTGPRGAFVGGPMERDDAWFDFINLGACWYFHGHGGWTITLKGQPNTVAGFVILGLEPGDHEPELGFLLLPEFEGQGIAYEAATAVRAFAAETLGMASLVSYIDPENARSQSLATRMGAIRDTQAETLFDDPICVYRHPNPTERQQ